MKLSMSNFGLLPIIVCSNDGLTLTYFKARSSFIPFRRFYRKKGKKLIFQKLAAYDLKILNCLCTAIFRSLTAFLSEKSIFTLTYRKA